MNGDREAEYWKRFDEVSNLIKIKRTLAFYPDLDPKEFFKMSKVSINIKLLPEKTEKTTLTKAKALSIAEELTSYPFCKHGCDDCPFTFEPLTDCMILYLSRRLDELKEAVNKCPECGGPATHPSGWCRDCHQSKLEAEG